MMTMTSESNQLCTNSTIQSIHIKLQTGFFGNCFRFNETIKPPLAVATLSWIIWLINTSLLPHKPLQAVIYQRDVDYDCERKSISFEYFPKKSRHCFSSSEECDSSLRAREHFS